jgi:hypothetical protein
VKFGFLDLGTLYVEELQRLIRLNTKYKIYTLDTFIRYNYVTDWMDDSW